MTKEVKFCVIFINKVLCFYSFDKYTIIGIGDYGPVKR